MYHATRGRPRAGRGPRPATAAGSARMRVQLQPEKERLLPDTTCWCWQNSSHWTIVRHFWVIFGAGAVRGFAITLALGVVINMFTAITVTRTFIRLAFDWMGERLRERKALMGI